MSSIYWVISGKVRSSDTACRALTRLDDDGKKQDGKFLRFDMPGKKSFVTLRVTWGPSHNKVTMWLNFFFWEMLCHLVTLLWLGPQVTIKWQCGWTFSFGKMLCHSVTLFCDWAQSLQKCHFFFWIMLCHLVTSRVSLWLNLFFWKMICHCGLLLSVYMSGCFDLTVAPLNHQL